MSLGGSIFLALTLAGIVSIPIVDELKKKSQVTVHPKPAKAKFYRDPAILIQSYKRFQSTAHPENVYAFGGLFSALSYNPTPEQLKFIGEQADAVLQKVDHLHADPENLLRDCAMEPERADPLDWKQHCTPEGYRALLIMGTLQKNGYMREKCLRLLQDQPNVLSFIILRAKDWVPAVRKIAQEMLPDLLRNAPIDELPPALPYLSRLHGALRIVNDTDFDVNSLDSIFLERFSADPAAVIRVSVQLRKLCYECLFRQDANDWKQLLLYWKYHEREGSQHDRLTAYYLRNTDNIPESELASYCHDKRWRIRYEACEVRFKQYGIWAGFETLLADSATPIREFAAFHLEQTGFDVMGYCRSHLPETVLALSELGGKSDIPAIRAHFDAYPNECLTALVRLGAPDSVFLVWDALHSESPRLARTAYRIAWARQMRFDTKELLTEIRSDADPKLRWRLFRLLRDMGDWAAMPTLIRMLRDYSHLRPDILDAIESRSKYPAHFTPELAAEIEDAMDYAGVLMPEKLRFDLHFDCLRYLN